MAERWRGDAALLPADAAPASSEEAEGDNVVAQGAAHERLSEYLDDSGPHAARRPGGAGLKNKVRERFEGEAGDAAHTAAMKEFSLAEFGSSHVQARAIDELEHPNVKSKEKTVF